MSKRAKPTKAVKKTTPTQRITKTVKKKTTQARPIATRVAKKNTAVKHDTPVPKVQATHAKPEKAPSLVTMPDALPVISNDILSAFFQKRVTYYSNRWERYRQKQFPGWNWAACFMGPWWFFYRRMPWYGLGFLALGLIAFIPKVGILALGINILVGFLGNEFYLSEFKHTYLAKAAAVDPVEPAYWARVGGVRNWAWVAMLCVYALILSGLMLIAFLAVDEIASQPQNVFSVSQQAPVLPQRPTNQALLDLAKGDACVQAGRLATEEGKLGKAVQSYTKALEYNPRLAVGFLKRGEVYARRGDWAQAEADFKRALELDPALKGQVDKIMEQKK